MLNIRESYVKKLAFALMGALLLVSLLIAGCSQEEGPAEEQGSSEDAASAVQVNVASLKGPTSIGIVGMMDQAGQEGAPSSYEFMVSGTADEILPNLIQGNVDIALLPANVASVVYNKTNGGVTVIDINTLGVLYVVSADDSISSLTDLAGRKVYLTGKGTAPELAIDYLLADEGIADQVQLEFKSEPAEVAALLAEDNSAIAILPEPYVTSVCMQNEECEPRVSLTEEWNELQKEEGGSSQLVTAVTVVRNEFLEQNPQAVEEFLALHAASVEMVNSASEEVGDMVVNAGIMDNAQMAIKAIPNCNIVCLTGSEMKTALSGYLAVLFEQDPATVGGSLPADDFYYAG